MQEVIDKASILLEALPYIQRFRDETVVIKFGGSIMVDKVGCQTILNDVAFMHCVGLRPVLVHGGGKAISRRMEEKGIAPRFAEGLRVTDEETVLVVEQVLNKETNPRLLKVLEQYKCKARGIHGEDIVEVVKYVRKGEALDWGRVGHIVGIDLEPINAYLHSHIVPVITPLGRGPEGELYNVNADQVAAAVAEGLKARKLVFLSNIPGVMRDPSDPQSRISTLRLEKITELTENGTIRAGMLPKIDGAVKALKAGVKKTHIVDAAMPHSLLLELFTDAGVGTEIVP